MMGVQGSDARSDRIEDSVLGLRAAMVRQAADSKANVDHRDAAAVAAWRNVKDEMQEGLDQVDEDQRIAVDNMAWNQREALNKSIQDMQASEARIFDNMALNADRMERRIQNLVTSGDQRAQDD